MDTGFRTEIGPGKEQADHAPTQPLATADCLTAARLNSARLKELGTDALAVADRLLRFGALRQAEQLYRDVLNAQADNAEAWSRLGEVCHSLRRPRKALRSYRRALELRPEARVHNNVGVALMELGQPDEATTSYEEALRLQPDFAEAHNNLGVARREQGQLDQAEASFQEALRLKPAYAAAHNNLGQVLSRQGRLQEAAACFGHAVQAQPDFARAWQGLGDALRGLGRLDEAGASYERAARLRPDDPEPLDQLGGLLTHLGRPADAITCYERVLRLRPESAAACNNLGLALLNARRLDEAVLSFRQALYLRPDLADAYNNLGLAVAARGNSEEALNCYERALAIAPAHFGALVNLGNAYKDQGLAAEALSCYRRALVVRPDDARIHSNLVLALNYQAGVAPQEILAEARRFAEQHAAPLASAIKPHPVRSLNGRRLRIGYVSTDFRDHAVAWFLEPVLATHDHQHFEVFCYADVLQPDAVTQRLQTYADRWRSLVGVSDAQAADIIYHDGIDILVDLSSHTGGNRLLVFARKPAPIQATYLGSNFTTGLSTIDYYVTDADADPPGVTEAYYEEQLIRLPACAFCYSSGPSPEVTEELPACRAGQVTFGCLNSMAKLSDPVLVVWSEVLAAVPRSRIMLRTSNVRRGETRIYDILGRHGIAAERVLFAGQMADRYDYLKLFQELDLCLDPFPYNGVTTTCEALWMGVPVISLAGHAGVSRQGVRFLRAVGLEELIADTPRAYVRRASELGSNWARLRSLRSGLRERMRRSPAMDGAQFTRNLEAAYVAMWEQWVSGGRST